MKILKLLPVLISAALITVGCSKNNEDTWYGPTPGVDYIKLSQKEVEFDAAAGSFVVTAELDGWWILQIVVDKGESFMDEYLHFKLDENNQIIDEIFEYEWFTVEKKNLEIHIVVLQNETGEDRKFYITVQSGNYFNTIAVTQRGQTEHIPE
ncbi:MAG: hypothetical protein LIO79_03335 [Rikenellaceae bacterium]|nr:hypothetical protein [Rikenellaceae bacterium]